MSISNRESHKKDRTKYYRTIVLLPRPDFIDRGYNSAHFRRTARIVSTSIKGGAHGRMEAQQGGHSGDN
jgi:hypothetical protein